MTELGEGPSAHLQVRQSRAERLTRQGVALPHRGTWTGRRNGLTESSRNSAEGSVKPGEGGERLLENSLAEKVLGSCGTQVHPRSGGHRPPGCIRQSHQPGGGGRSLPLPTPLRHPAQKGLQGRPGPSASTGQWAGLVRKLSFHLSPVQTGSSFLLHYTRT